MRPRLLDLFCGAGGCSVGYHEAGFDVVGVDIKPQPRYPFEFVQADALEYLAAASGFDAIHASPPCQRYSCAAKRAGTTHRHPDSLPATRSSLNASRLPWVIENVYGAPIDGLMLCGTMFGLELYRHRFFEVNWPLGPLGPATCHHVGKVYSVFGHGSGKSTRPDHGTVADWRRAMGIDWMTRDELAQAIPPAYTEFIGKQLLEAVR